MKERYHINLVGGKSKGTKSNKGAKGGRKSTAGAPKKPGGRP